MGGITRKQGQLVIFWLLPFVVNKILKKKTILKIKFNVNFYHAVGRDGQKNPYGVSLLKLVIFMKLFGSHITRACLREFSKNSQI